MRRAKIIATIGPASSSHDTLVSIINLGLDVARINMSHGDKNSCTSIIKNIRKASAEVGREVAILMDLQGPKIRVDKLESPLNLQAGEEWLIGTKDSGKKLKGSNFIPTTYDNLVADCQDGARILFNDGLIKAEAIEREGECYRIKILSGGTLTSNKGINLPGVNVSALAFTEKDRKDLELGLKNDIDYVALSFVKSGQDVSRVKEFIAKAGKYTPVIAKIERQEAIDNIDNIFEEADGIMVARGDLGVELGNHKVPLTQKKIIELCNLKRKPVITATQMLESMIENPSPTRAEASDIANAIWDGSDAVMLSGETAVGKHPIDCFKTMIKIVEEVETTPKPRRFLRDIEISSIGASVMMAASVVAEKIEAKKIISVTEYGRSCRNLSLLRPRREVFAITPKLETARRMNLYWGITPYHLKEYDKNKFDFNRDVIENLSQVIGISKGDKVVITHGHEGEFFYGMSNSVKVETI